MVYTHTRMLIGLVSEAHFQRAPRISESLSSGSISIRIFIISISIRASVEDFLGIFVLQLPS